MTGYEILKKPIFVALDLDDDKKVLEIVRQTHHAVGGFKIGPRLIFKYGLEVIGKIASFAPVFLDFKFYDIPSTMESSIRAAFDAGVSFVTVHATAGEVALSGLAKLEKELSQKRPFHILAVTILTSFSQENLPPNFNKDPISSQVFSLVQMSFQSGIKSFVCSPHEVKALCEKFPQCYFVTPGIRSGLEKIDDQKRTATAKEALVWGAAAIVIGRPVLQAHDPKSFVEKLLI